MHKGLCEIAGTFVPDSPGYFRCGKIRRHQKRLRFSDFPLDEITGKGIAEGSFENTGQIRFADAKISSHQRNAKSRNRLGVHIPVDLIPEAVLRPAPYSGLFISLTDHIEGEIEEGFKK